MKAKKIIESIGRLRDDIDGLDDPVVAEMLQEAFGEALGGMSSFLRRAWPEPAEIDPQVMSVALSLCTLPRAAAMARRRLNPGLPLRNKLIEIGSGGAVNERRIH